VSSPMLQYLAIVSYHLKWGKRWLGEHNFHRTE
jgi:hypothetical protein